MRLTRFAAVLVGIAFAATMTAAEPVRSAGVACSHLVGVAGSLKLAGTQASGKYICSAESETSEFFVLALRYVGPEIKDGTSNLVGYYAVNKPRAEVYEWDFVGEKSQRLVWPRALKDHAP